MTRGRSASDWIRRRTVSWRGSTTRLRSSFPSTFPIRPSVRPERSSGPKSPCPVADRPARSGSGYGATGSSLLWRSADSRRGAPGCSRLIRKVRPAGCMMPHVPRLPGAAPPHRSTARPPPPRPSRRRAGYLVTGMRQARRRPVPGARWPQAPARRGGPRLSPPPLWRGRRPRRRAGHASAGRCPARMEGTRNRARRSLSPVTGPAPRALSLRPGSRRSARPSHRPRLRGRGAGRLRGRASPGRRNPNRVSGRQALTPSGPGL